jgi:Domain of unknown function (DUF4399)
MLKKSFVSVIALTLFLATAIAGAHSPPDNANVYFVNIADGDVVESPFKLVFGITPAGDSAKDKHNAGHYHLLVDVEQLPDMDEAIPIDAHHIHFDQVVLREEENGEITVAFMDPEAILKLVDQEEIGTLAKEVRSRLERVRQALGGIQAD